MSHAIRYIRSRLPQVAAMLALAALMLTQPSTAATFKVGTGANCNYGSIAAALAAAENSPSPNTIRITRSSTYTQQAITFTTSQEVTLTGGYADCTTNLEDATYTTINGAGGAAATVLTVNGNAGSAVHLRKLTITGGDLSPSSTSIAGGGIYYTGNGLLDVADSSISNNTGMYGGGINAGGTGEAARLVIGANTTIFGNTAYYNGGGIFSNNLITEIREDNTIIDFNIAAGVSIGGGAIQGGYGGGIHIRACILPSIVYLGSPGVGSLGVVYSNSARYGGGVAIEGADGCENDKNAELRMFSTHVSRLTKLQANNASVMGGALYLYPFNAFNTSTGRTNTFAYVWNASIEENNAPEASAIYLGSDSNLLVGSFAQIYFNRGGAPAGAVACAFGVPCGRISGNGGPGSGRLVYGNEFNDFNADRLEISGNQGSELIRLDDTFLSNSLVTGNITTARLIEGRYIGSNGSTIAGNSIGGAQVLGIKTEGHAALNGTIIWQPGKLALHNDGDAAHVLDVLSNDISTLTGSQSARLIVADPRFVDAAHGDYSLTAASEAVDFAPADSSNPRDLHGHNRDLDFDLFYNDYGPRDLGALEREAVQPLVLNSDFNLGVNTWPEVTAGASSWDSTQNSSGSGSSGSLRVNLSSGASTVTVRKQCIHLPGPGDYALNGWGKSTGTITPGDNVKLVWEYRSAGSESCTGTPTSSGSLLLANSGAWRRPPLPAHVVVSDFAWTTDSSILVYLVVEDSGGIGGALAGTNAAAEGNAMEGPAGGSLIGWFDGITLEVVTDRIFRNGFDGL